jgi:hypothetical protein
MPNQMIALQSRGANIPDPTAQTAKFVNMMNMAKQQEAAQRQASLAQQTMDINQAQEARAVELQPFAVTKASSEAGAAKVKYIKDFLETSEIALANSRDARQATALGDRIKQMFPEPELQQSIDATISSIPQDPGQFEAWRQDSLMRTMNAKDQLENEYKTQTTGTEQREISMPKYGRGMATEVPGSRIGVAEGMTYVKGDDGSIYPMPSKSGGGFATPAPSAGAPGKGGVAAALQTNPGALKDGAFAKSQAGYTGASGGFATFNTPQAGIAAQENLLRGSYINKGFNTVNKIIDRYAPQGPENSAASVSNYKKYVAQKAGVDINAPLTAAQVPAIAKAMREFETGNTSGGRGTAGAPVAVIKGSGAKAKPSTEGERRFGTVSQNMTDSMKEATAALLESSAAAAPSGTEYAASLIPFYGDEARKFAQSGPRQRFEGALLALLDGVTFINTGAGTSKTQEANYKNTYVPTYQDTPKSRKAKLDRAIRFIENSKAAAGVMWTPEIDRELKNLKATVAKIDFGGSAAKRSTPTKSSDGWGTAKQVGN